MSPTVNAPDIPLERQQHEPEPDHKFLRQQLDWLLNARDEAAIAALLDDLGEYAVQHFTAEERDGGLFDFLITEAPRLARRVEMLRAEHAVLTRDIRALRGTVHAPFGRADSTLLDGVRHLVAVLRAHEGVEEHLLQDALESDLGTGD